MRSIRRVFSSIFRRHTLIAGARRYTIFTLRGDLGCSAYCSETHEVTQGRTLSQAVNRLQIPMDRDTKERITAH